MLKVFSWSFIWCLSLCTLWSSIASAEPPVAERGRIISRTYHSDAAHKEITYALYVPSKYDEAKPSPLVVLLHGLGSNPVQVLQYQGIQEEADRRGYLVVAPYGYNEFGGYGAWGTGRAAFLPHNAGDGVPENLGELSEQDVLHVLGLVRKDYQVDGKRIYLMGHSMGGGGTLFLGMKHPELWAGLAALSPAIYSNPEELKKIRTMPIMVVQGDMDRLVKVENTRRWVDAMKELKMDYRYLEIKGGDHIFSICANPKMIGEVFDFFDRHS